MMGKSFAILAIILFIMLFVPPVAAVECTDANLSNLSQYSLIDLTSLSDKCAQALASMEKAVQPHREELDRMNRAIAAFKQQIKVIEADVAKKTAEIRTEEQQLRLVLTVAERKIKSLYIRSYSFTPFTLFFSTGDLGLTLRSFGYQQATINEDKATITETAITIKDLEGRKKSLENEKATLAKLQADTDAQAASLRQLVAQADAYESKLQGWISAITAAQQAILNARGGTFTTSVGDVPLADDPNAAPNFNPGFSPAFAGFSFGAYTHRKGMSQYGAKGRAEAGQKFDQILQAYYRTGPVGKDTGGNINVSGYGSMDFETAYLYGIAEMPASFPMDALKAQAIAARTYAYGYKTSGSAICPSDSCQVWSKSKSANPPQQWKDAVDQTKGQVLEGVTAFYSSTTGGYITTTGWDTTDGNFGNFAGNAWESKAGSPWFYKGWYTSTYYNSSDKCGRSHPWLTQEEFADILNAWVVLTKGGDKSRVLPVTINSCPVGGASGNPYSTSEMRDAAGSLGGAYSSISSVSVTYNSGGYTDSVNIETNRGPVAISGSDFKQAFNLRAPGYISIRSPLYNIEKK